MPNKPSVSHPWRRPLRLTIPVTSMQGFCGPATRGLCKLCGVYWAWRQDQEYCAPCYKRVHHCSTLPAREVRL